MNNSNKNEIHGMIHETLIFIWTVTMPKLVVLKTQNVGSKSASIERYGTRETYMKNEYRDDYVHAYTYMVRVRVYVYGCAAGLAWRVDIAL